MIFEKGKTKERGLTMFGTGVSTLTGIIAGTIIPYLEKNHEADRARLEECKRLLRRVSLGHVKWRLLDTCPQCEIPYPKSEQNGRMGAVVCKGDHEACDGSLDEEEPCYEKCKILLVCGRSWCTMETAPKCIYCRVVLCAHDTWKCGVPRDRHRSPFQTPCEKKMCGSCAKKCDMCEEEADDIRFCADHLPVKTRWTCAYDGCRYDANLCAGCRHDEENGDFSCRICSKIISHKSCILRANLYAKCKNSMGETFGCMVCIECSNNLDAAEAEPPTKKQK
jgi:hypothetical protein